MASACLHAKMSALSEGQNLPIRLYDAPTLIECVDSVTLN